MIKLAITQWVVLFLLAIVLYVVWGVHHAVSLLLGGASYAIPTLISVLFLNFLKPYPALAGGGFVLAESLKILLSLILMIGSFFVYPNVYFLSFFIGLLIVSHLIFLLFLKVYRYGSK
jgi:hypothetical protein